MESLQEDLEMHQHTSSGVNPLTIPSATEAWFNLEEIHPIEMDSLPEFFSGRYPSKNPQVYKEYRNFMIMLYRQNPTAYLTATSK
jgi:hypothetical protein